MKDAPNDQYTPHNDNDADSPLPFITIAALTANVISYFSTAAKHSPTQSENSPGDAKPEERSERGENTEREYVIKRMRELAEFESYANGERKRPGRGPAGRKL